MNILGLDTSAVSCGAAVCRDGKIVSDVYINVGLTHSQTVLCAVNSALENGSVSLDDVDALAVAAGPGSFTGIRIGVSAVKEWLLNAIYPFSVCRRFMPSRAAFGEKLHYLSGNGREMFSGLYGAVRV